MSDEAKQIAPPQAKAAPRSSSDSGGVLKFVLGIAVGMGGAYFSVKYDRSAPTVLSLPGKLAALPLQMVASELLEAPDADLGQRQRAIAELLKHDDKLFARIDNRIANQFTNAVIHETFDHRLKLAKAYRHSLDRVLEDGKYQALRRVLERKHQTTDTELLRIRMLAERLRDDELLYALLQEKKPGRSAEELARDLLEPARLASASSQQLN